jgi:hypothetical protein
MGTLLDGYRHKPTRPGVASAQGWHNRRCASQYQNSNKCKRVIRLVDVDGQVSTVIARGWLNTTSHQLILNSLSHCGLALPGQSTPTTDGHHAWTLDEIGTIRTDNILCVGNDLCFNEVERNEVTKINKLDVPDKILTLHGSLLPTKPDGIVRLIYKNVNGLNNKLANNKKVERAKEIHDKLEVDIVVYNEHQLNMRHPPNINGFNQ